jgi:6-phospho-beta-glucosidase
MKIAVIGGGSTYTPELVSGFIQKARQLPLSELCLMDIDQARLSVVGGFSQRLVRASGGQFDIRLTANRQQAIQRASYVITQFRVGGMAARREDEYLGRRHGLIGQETTGVGGMAKALRTIPVLLEIVQDMRQLAPQAWLVNFTNPSGLATQALADCAPDIRAVGVCNVPITAKMHLLVGLEADGHHYDPDQVQLDTLGLNHLSWHRGLKFQGQDLWPLVMELILREPAQYELGHWDQGALRALGMIPNYYLGYYYYTPQKLAEQERWPPSRAEQVMVIEQRLLAYYADQAHDRLPPELMERGGAYYSTMAAGLLAAHHNDSREVQVVNAPHQGAVAGWPDEWVLELPCMIDRDGATPLPAEPLPPEAFALVAAVKAFEMLTIQAAVDGDRRAACRALLAHPLGPSADRVEAVLEDMMETNRSYLPAFR